MDNIVESQKFANVDEEVSQDLIGRIVDWVERQNYYPTAKRLNYSLARVNDNKLEITPEGNDKNEDGNWRFFIDDNGDLLIQKQVDGVWTNYLLEKGTAVGQIAFWDGVKWTHTEIGEAFWDDANKRLGLNQSNPSSTLDVNETVTVKRLLAGGVREN